MTKQKSNEPESGKVYQLTGGSGTPSIANGNTWEQSEVKTKLKCPKCGSEEFTADVFYNVQVELYENCGWDIVSNLEGEELDTGSIQCLECGEDFPYPSKKIFIQKGEDE